MTEGPLHGEAAEPGGAMPVSPTDGSKPTEPESREPESTRYSQSQLGRTRELLTRLYAARRSASFYPMDHPAVREAVMLLHDTVSAFHAEGVDVELGFFEGEILMGEQLLAEDSILFDGLIRGMMSLGVGSLLIGRGANVAEVARAVQLLATDPQQIAEAGGLTRALEPLGFVNVRIGALTGLERVDSSEITEDAHASYGKAVSLLRELSRSVSAGRGPGKLPVRNAVRSLVDNVVANRRAMLQLTGLKNYDEYTYFHSANVAVLAIGLGSLITHDYRFLSALGTGALLHDIGKLALDQRILNKAGALTPEEWEYVRRHPVDGAQIVALMPGVDRSAIVTVLEHHMRYDGTGYPQVNPKRPMRLSSRIVAVADSYDAMTSKRSYSVARVQDEAMSVLIDGAGTALDPVLVRLFVKLVGAYPPRSVVRLSGGDIALVVQPGDLDPFRPVVRIVAAPNGEFITPVDVDLGVERSVTIAETIDSRLVNIDVDAFFD